jgi:hypothetical protein
MSEFFNAFLSAFGDHLHDHAFMTDYFRKHTREVIRTISGQRLLVYQVDQGWEPLCKFLEVAVPLEPFPAQNTRAELIARAVRASQTAKTATAKAKRETKLPNIDPHNGLN